MSGLLRQIKRHRARLEGAARSLTVDEEIMVHMRRVELENAPFGTEVKIRIRETGEVRSFIKSRPTEAGRAFTLVPA